MGRVIDLVRFIKEKEQRELIDLTIEENQFWHKAWEEACIDIYEAEATGTWLALRPDWRTTKHLSNFLRSKVPNPERPNHLHVPLLQTMKDINEPTTKNVNIIVQAHEYSLSVIHKRAANKRWLLLDIYSAKLHNRKTLLAKRYGIDGNFRVLEKCDGGIDVVVPFSGLHMTLSKEFDRDSASHLGNLEVPLNFDKQVKYILPEKEIAD